MIQKFTDLESPKKEQDSASNPVLSLYFSCVVLVDGTYHAFGTYNSLNKIHHATSDDGVTFGDPVEALVNVSGLCYCPTIWTENGTWYMIYADGSHTAHVAVSLATADTIDGEWTKYASNPVFSNETAIWGAGAEPWGLIKSGGIYYMWFNNYGSGNPRRLGLITSSDVIGPWIQLPNNPIFDYRRFCPCPFKFGEKFFLIVTHMLYNTAAHSEFELYSCDDPTFLPSKRTLLGSIHYSAYDSSKWYQHDLDTSYILAGIDRDVTNTTPLVIYFSGERGGVWNDGMMTIDPQLLQDGKFNPVFYCSDQATSSIAYSSDSVIVKDSDTSLKISPTAYNEYCYAGIGISRGYLEFDYYQTGAGTLDFTFVDENDEICFFMEFLNRTFQYTNPILKDAGLNRTYNEWGHIKIWWNAIGKRWGAILKNASGTRTFVNLDMRMNKTGFIQGLLIYRIATSVGTFYLDNFVVGRW